MAKKITLRTLSNKYFSEVGKNFSKPQAKHFKNLLNSMIETEGRRTISRLNMNQLNGTDVSNDIKFLKNSKWNKNDLLDSNKNYLKKFTSNISKGFYIIDDTIIEKQGKPKKMEGLDWHYSHSKGKSVCGHCMVSSHYRVDNISFPSNFEFYYRKKTAKELKKEFKTKLEIAADLINNFEPFNEEQIYILADSWYTTQKVVNTGLARNFHFIGALKSNRMFKFNKYGMKHKLSTYAKNLRNPSFEKVKIKDEVFKVRRVNGYIKGIGNVVILVSKRLKDRSKMYILNTDMTLSNEEILRYYSYRWDVEVGYLYCKDRLGMGQYQIRKIKAIEKYCALIFAAFGLLEILRVKNNEQSIGKSRKIFQIMKKKEYIDLVISYTRRGVSKNEIYKKLKLVA